MAKKNKIAVVRLWDGLKNAEYEVIERFRATADDLGVELVEIDSTGKMLDGSGKDVSSADVDFVLHLHFETPKSYDAYSYVALWNPLKFYFEWGYEKFTSHLLSHDDYISCGSAWADDHVKRRIMEDETRDIDFPVINHTLSKPILKTNLDDPRIFYAGINWERLGKEGKGRHQGVLEILDSQDVIKIFGPKRFLGVDVWEGYKNYSGFIPFDGSSLIEEINKCGVSLVFSSDAHRESELMSMRLFESLAAGAVVISDEHKFIRDNFGDTVLYVDHAESEEDVAAQVLSHISWIKKNPDEAKALAMRAQNIFIEKYSLELQLKQLIEGHETRQKKREKALLASRDHEAHICMFTYRTDVESGDQCVVWKKAVSSLAKQSYKTVKAHFFIDDEIDGKTTRELLDFIEQEVDYPVAIKVLPLSQKSTDAGWNYELNGEGSFLAEIAQSLPYGSVLFPACAHGEWFEDHVSIHMRQYENNNKMQMVASNGVLLCAEEEKGPKCTFFEAGEFTHVVQNKAFGQFSFSAAYVNEIGQMYFDYLDLEHLTIGMCVVAEEMAHCRDVTGRYADITGKCDKFTSKVHGNVQSQVVKDLIMRNDFSITQLSSLQMKVCYHIASIKANSLPAYIQPLFMGARPAEAWLTYGLVDKMSEQDKRKLSVLIVRFLPIPDKLRRMVKWAYNKFLRKD